MKIVTEKTLKVPHIPIHKLADICDLCTPTNCGGLPCSECIYDESNYDTFRNLMNRDGFYVTRKEED